MTRVNSRWEDTFIAASDLSAKLYFAVKQTTTEGKVDLAGDGEAAIGILQTHNGDKNAVNVMLEGESLAVVGAEGIVTGDLAGVNVDGKVVTATSGDYVIGICLDGGNGSDGKLASILLRPNGKA